MGDRAGSVACVVVTYDALPWIERCLESVAGVETVVVDNGSAETALGWAADQGLAWVDLGVFSENAPARALYRKLGFEEVGIVEDAFRVDGSSLDDVAMVFRLPSP